jgi:hypothetical protein
MKFLSSTIAMQIGRRFKHAAVITPHHGHFPVSPLERKALKQGAKQGERK